MITIVKYLTSAFKLWEELNLQIFITAAISPVTSWLDGNSVISVETMRMESLSAGAA